MRSVGWATLSLVASRCRGLHIIEMLFVPNRPAKEQLMTIHDPLTTDAVLAAFDEHLRRTRGVCPEVRHTYTRFVRVFLEEVFEGGPVDPARICVRDIVEFVSAMTPRYRPPTEIGRE